MDLKIDEEFKALLPSVSYDEMKALEQDIRSNGIKNPLIVWKGIVVDGHKRFEICTRLGIIPPTKEKTFQSRNNAMIWIVKNYMETHELTPFQNCELALKLYPIFHKQAVKEQQKAQDWITKQRLAKTKMTKLEKDGKEKSQDYLIAKADWLEAMDKIKREFIKINSYKEISKIVGLSDITLTRVKKILEFVPENIVNKARQGEVAITTLHNVLKQQKLKGDWEEVDLKNCKCECKKMPLEELIEDWRNESKTEVETPKETPKGVELELVTLVPKNFIIDKVFDRFRVPLSNQETLELADDIKSRGCDYIFTIWKEVDPINGAVNEIIIDGIEHYQICKKENKSFTFVEKQFPSRADVCIWIVKNEIGHKKLTELQRAELAVKLLPILKKTKLPEYHRGCEEFVNYELAKIANVSYEFITQFREKLAEVTEKKKDIPKVSKNGLNITEDQYKKLKYVTDHASSEQIDDCLNGRTSFEELYRKLTYKEITVDIKEDGKVHTVKIKSSDPLYEQFLKLACGVE